MADENQDISSMPIEELIYLVYIHMLRNSDFLSVPQIKSRLSEIVAYKGPICDYNYSFPLITTLCMKAEVMCDTIIELLDNGADPNISYTYEYGDVKITKRPLDAFIGFCTLDSEKERKVLCTLLDYGADMDLIDEQWADPNSGCPAHLRDIKDFCDKYLAEQEELLCKEPAI